NDVIRGFCSGSLNVEKQQELFKRKRVKLALSLFSTVFLNPKIIFDVLNRYLSLDKNSKDSFILKKGARSEYWTWEKDANDSEFSVELLNRFYNIFYLCGVKEVFFEVDEINKKIIKIHKLNKAVIVDEFQLPDLRKRLVMKYDLINKFDK
ncbi:MAG: hypothetical protein QG594_240, partial [Bacteroidota bacterium]|nr:hypothetical protein [Bacteroidota bacterium]